MEKRETAVYETVERLMYSHGTKFKKKHGNWIVRYCKSQIVFMDTWNGCIYQAHGGKTVEDDGFVDCQLHPRVHTILTDRECPVDDGVYVYKTILDSIV